MTLHVQQRATSYELPDVDWGAPASSVNVTFPVRSAVLLSENVRFVDSSGRGSFFGARFSLQEFGLVPYLWGFSSFISGGMRSRNAWLETDQNVVYRAYKLASIDVGGRTSV